MKVYVETNPETIYSGRVKDEVKTTEIRMWFETDEEIEVLPISDYNKQVRKEVCEEIKDLAGNYFELPYCDNCGETNNDDVVLTGNDLAKILDRIQGEPKKVFIKSLSKKYQGDKCEKQK